MDDSSRHQKVDSIIPNDSTTIILKICKERPELNIREDSMSWEQFVSRKRP